VQQHLPLLPQVFQPVVIAQITGKWRNPAAARMLSAEVVVSLPSVPLSLDVWLKPFLGRKRLANSDEIPAAAFAALFVETLQKQST